MKRELNAQKNYQFFQLRYYLKHLILLTPRWKVLFPSINWQLLRGKDHFWESEVLEDLRAKSVIFCFFKKKKTLHNLFHG